MKKTITSVMVLAGLFIYGSSFAQSNSTLVENEPTLKEIVESIPSLKKHAEEIARFESKIEGRKGEYKNANADMIALKKRYAEELQNQILQHQGKEEVTAVLQKELNKVNEEINAVK